MVRSRALGRALFLLLVPVLVAVPLGSPLPAIAAPAERFLDERIELPVGRLESPLGIVLLHARFGKEAPPQALGLWGPGADPDIDPPVFLADPDRAARYELAGSLLRATVPLIDVATGEPAGEATIVAELAAAGDREPIETRDRAGNVWNREIGWRQAVSATGSIAFPGDLSFAFRDVQGSVSVVQTFRTQPDARILGQTYSFVLAFVSGEDGFAAVATVLEPAGHGWAEILFVPSNPEIPTMFGATGLPAVDPLGAEFDIPLESGGESARVRLSLARTPGQQVYKLRRSTSLTTVVEEVLRPEGSMTFPGGFVFDLSSATATLVSSHVAVSDPDGGRPAGTTPVNDRPSGAVRLAVGDEVKGVWTGGASMAPEEAFGGDLGYTVWYRIDGDGGAVTLDTDGTDFDTVIYLYRDTGSGLEFLGDADDRIVGRTDAARVVQARATFETERGTTYYAQIGGADADADGIEPEHGRLTVTVTRD